MKCGIRYVIYLMSCKCFGKQYVGSATGFKEKFRTRKSDINNGEVSNVCRSSASKFEYLQVQLIKKVSLQNDDDIDKVLWERKKCR